MRLEDRTYRPDCARNDCSLEDYFTRTKTFGYFSEDGRSYTVTNPETPRPWAQYLVNDKIRVAIANRGEGFIYHARGIRVTKHRETDKGGNYLPRNFNGKRTLTLLIDGYSHSFFDAPDLIYTVRPGSVHYTASVAGIRVEVSVLVPQNAPCESTLITLTSDTDKAVTLTFSVERDAEYPFSVENNCFISDLGEVTAYFFADGTDFTGNKVHTVEYNDKSIDYRSEYLTKAFSLTAGTPTEWAIVSAAIDAPEQLSAVQAFSSPAAHKAALADLELFWDTVIDANHCTLPDKNAEMFLNIWLKNQIYLTYRYDRGNKYTGYRDGLQDSWGYLLVEPEKAKERVLTCLANMMEDGRCPRQIARYGDKHDYRDFADSPIWAPIFLSYYIKVTGDFDILDTVLPYLNSDKTGTVSEHIDTALDYLYHSRGIHGFIKMRDGDWADGLSGINKYGDAASSVWLTVATYYAQNLMAELYAAIGDSEKFDTLTARSAEYKEIVNEKGWDGKWFCYGFFADGEPIGSHKNLEGKIWLNPQTWALFSGIVDDPARRAKIVSSVSRYLDTPYGGMVLFPPYVFHGERCGRIQRQRPGMFLNGAVYNHGASFKVFADTYCGDGEQALDTFQRCLPNHPDNSDTRRTSEPYEVGNVYYGSAHARAGMNLFGWFSATPSWLIHGGFDEILGVHPELDGLRLAPCVPDEWESYKVTRTYRGTKYDITFVRDEEKYILLDGQKIDGNTVFSENETCSVEVHF